MNFLVYTIAKMADPVILGTMSFLVIFLCIFCGGPLNRLNEQEVTKCLRVYRKLQKRFVCGEPFNMLCVLQTIFSRFKITML